MSKKELKFEVIEHLAVLEVFASGWTLEFNVVKWADGVEKFDIRNWNADHSKCSKGITLFDREMDSIVKAYKAYKKK